MPGVKASGGRTGMKLWLATLQGCLNSDAALDVVADYSGVFSRERRITRAAQVKFARKSAKPGLYHFNQRSFSGFCFFWQCTCELVMKDRRYYVVNNGSLTRHFALGKSS
jgi:hypothetical protein